MDDEFVLVSPLRIAYTGPILSPISANLRIYRRIVARTLVSAASRIVSTLFGFVQRCWQRRHKLDG
jgi:hypothetical protein